MHNKQNHKTNSTFWSQLEADIDKYSYRAKKNIKVYEALQYQNQINHKKNKLKNTEPAQQSRNPSVASISTLRSRTKEEKHKQQAIRNRLHYMKVDKNRRLQSAQLAKKKYEKVQFIRSQSVKDKEFIKSEIETYRQNDLESQKCKAQKVRQERQNISKSIKAIQEFASLEAKSVRSQSAKNERIIFKNNTIDLQMKKEKVTRVQCEEEKSRKKLLEFGRQKIMEGKRNKDRQLWEQYQKYQFQQQKNKTLLAHFKREARSIQKSKAKADKDLKAYSSFLKANKKQHIQSGSSHDTFYVTEK